MILCHFNIQIIIIQKEIPLKINGYLYKNATNETIVDKIIGVT